MISLPDVLACPGGREKISWKKSVENAVFTKFLFGNLLKTPFSGKFFLEIC
jgi:hypothetical protein